MTPSRSYTPVRRPGARCSWPPDDSWSLTDLVAELMFWRNHSALGAYARGPAPAVVIPAQRVVSVAERDLNQRIAAYHAAQAREARHARRQ